MRTFKKWSIFENLPLGIHHGVKKGIIHSAALQLLTRFGKIFAGFKIEQVWTAQNDRDRNKVHVIIVTLFGSL